MFVQNAVSILLKRNLCLFFSLSVPLCVMLQFNSSLGDFEESIYFFFCLNSGTASAFLLASLINPAVIFLSGQSCCFWPPCAKTPAGRHQSSIVTHQLKGQHFVGSWVVYNLLKVSSNCKKTNKSTKNNIKNVTCDTVLWNNNNNNKESMKPF